MTSPERDLMRRVSMSMRPSSLMITPTRRPCAAPSTRLSNVVFPAPRKPVTMSSGTGSPMTVSDGEHTPSPSTTASALPGPLARAADRLARDDPSAHGDWLTRFVMLRLLGLCYLMAFLTLANQGPALLGAHGLLPLPQFLDAVTAELGSRAAGFAQLPSIFWLADGDTALRVAGWTGVALAALVLAGFANTPILGAL